MIDQIDQDPIDMSNTDENGERASDENGRNSDDDEIDITDKVKNEEMNIGRNIIRRQIFIPEVSGNWILQWFFVEFEFFLIRDFLSKIRDFLSKIRVFLC